MPPEIENDEVVDRGDTLPDETTLDDKPDDLPEGDAIPSLDGEKDEAPESDEERAEREAAEAEAEAKKRIRIPKARFDEAISKARQREDALKQEIAELRSGQQRAQVSGTMAEISAKIEELQDKYEDLILDGMKDDARKVRRELDAQREALIDLKTSVKSEQARKSAIEELQYDAVLAGIEAKYPVLNPEGPVFDAEKTDEVVVLLEAFVARGFNRQTALQKAVKYVMGGDTPAPAAKTSENVRDIDARRKAAEANRRQPADSTKVGKDSDRDGKDFQATDISRMSQDRFAKLDDDTLAKLRGDVL